jgi:hypothetical protein
MQTPAAEQVLYRVQTTYSQLNAVGVDFICETDVLAVFISPQQITHTWERLIS